MNDNISLDEIHAELLKILDYIDTTLRSQGREDRVHRTADG